MYCSATTNTVQKKKNLREGDVHMKYFEVPVSIVTVLAVVHEIS